MTTSVSSLGNASLQFQALSQAGVLPGVQSPTPLLALHLFTVWFILHQYIAPSPTQSHFLSFTSSLPLSFHLPAGSQFTHVCQSVHIMIKIVRAFRNDILINLY